MKRFGEASWAMLAAVLSLVPTEALAVGSGGTGFPWDTAFSNLFTNLSGVVGPIIVGIAVIFIALAAMWAAHGIAGKAGAAVAGGSVVFGLPLFMTALGWAGAVL